ncbi:hypothetical protein L195_g052979, partial [Trifolium pratense]
GTIPGEIVKTSNGCGSTDRDYRLSEDGGGVSKRISESKEQRLISVVRIKVDVDRIRDSQRR